MKTTNPKEADMNKELALMKAYDLATFSLTTLFIIGYLLTR